MTKHLSASCFTAKRLPGRDARIDRARKIPHDDQKSSPHNDQPSFLRGADLIFIDARMMSSFNKFGQFLRQTVPWTCRGCLRRQTLPPRCNTFTTKPIRPIAKNKRRRRLAIITSGLAVSAVGVTISDDAKHGITAAQRSARVVSTLFLNINEYAHFKDLDSAQRLTDLSM